MSSYIPFSLFDSFQRDVSRQLANRPTVQSERPPAAPPVDVVENDEAYLLTMDVPGVAGDAIEVTVHDGVLEVRGERSIQESDKYRSSLQERWQGKFLRRFQLPETADDEQIAARVEHGVLALHIPKRAQQTPRRITVQ